MIALRKIYAIQDTILCQVGKMISAPISIWSFTFFDGGAMKETEVRIGIQHIWYADLLITIWIRLEDQLKIIFAF
jgi:hypothetical protein